MIRANLNVRKKLRELRASKSGGVLIYISFALPILLGAMALSIDLGRAFILNTELKDFADAVIVPGYVDLGSGLGIGGTLGGRISLDTKLGEQIYGDDFR